MTLREQVIEEARTWVNTPFKHRGRKKGVGVDCIGLVAEVGKKFDLWEYQKEQVSQVYKGYSRTPHDDMIRQAMNRYGVRILHSQLKPADIILLAFSKNIPSHVAIYTGSTLIHALSKQKFCTEHSINHRWQSMFVGFYRYPGLVDE